MDVIDALCKEVDAIDVNGQYNRMEGVPPKEMHGSIAIEKKVDWVAPRLVTFCDTDARPGYNTRKAHEYEDEPSVLKAKIKALAELIRKAKNFVTYTGAGISTGSGIADYASKAKDSKALDKPKLKNVYEARPTLAHFVLAELYHKGFLKYWVQQNHDGLPQKARFPQEYLNEIHGAWFDPSNPVVPMEGQLRDDLFSDLQTWRDRCDLCVAIGTSLAGMNADQMVTKTANRSQLDTKVLGSVIIGLQQTQHDKLTKLRIFAKIDTVMALLAHEMGLSVKLEPYVLQVPDNAKVGPDRFLIRYDADGNLVRSKEAGSILDLSKNAKIMLTAGPGKGFKGIVLGKDSMGNYVCQFPNQRQGAKMFGLGKAEYMLGSWWVQTAINGTTPTIPVVNFVDSE